MQKQIRGSDPSTRRTPETQAAKELTATRKAGSGSIFQGPLVRAAVRKSFRKLDPRAVAKNPVMFVVEIGAMITTIVLIQQIITGSGNVGFTLQITFWLWFTVVFANFAEASTEGRTFGILGEPRVNVLQLNRALDAAGKR